MTAPVYGLIFNETETAPYALVQADLSTIGLVLCQDDADATTFPLGQPVFFNSSDPAYITAASGSVPKIGATGDLARAIASINNQVTQFQYGAAIVVVTVTRGADLPTTIAAIVAALPILLQAGPNTGYIPRLIGCPGYTGYQATPATANPVCAALPAILTSLNAVAYVSDAGDGVLANALSWRQLLASERLIPCDAWVLPGAGGAIYYDGVAEALGLQVSVDSQHNSPAGSVPGWSISGQQVQGIGGLKNHYPFSLTDGACQGQELLAAQIAVIESGVIGSDTAATSSGFVWQGVWNASTDPNKWFVNKRRMKDWCYLQLIKSMRRHLGIENTTPQSIEDVLLDMKVLGSFLLSQQISIGFKVSFVASQTSPSNLQQGQFAVGFANETPAPITLITVLSSDYYQALVVEEQTIIAEASGITPEYIAGAAQSTGV
jgi:hypothetical protein